MRDRLLVLLTFCFISTFTFSQKYTIIKDVSYAEWHAGSHYGIIELSSGEISVKENKIRKGEFVLDMNTLTNTDISNEQVRAMFVDHLKSESYFNTAKYPVGTIKIDPVNFPQKEKASFRVKATITLMNKKRVMFFTIEKNKNFFSANIAINNVQEFFEGISKNMVPDEMLIKVHISTTESEEE